VKIHKSIRKFRRLYLSNVYLYVLSEDKIKFKVSALKVRKLISSLNSSEFVLLTDHKSLLIDDLALREKMKKELLELNPAIEIVYVKEPLLDEYAEGTKVDEKEETLTLNLVRLRNEYEEFGANKKEKHFYELYSSVDLVLKDEYFMLMTAEKKNEGKAEKKGFSLFKREKKEFFTVKVYLKKLIGQNCALREQILRERKCLEEVLSPYIPVLSKCMSSRSSIYCITDYYRGNLLSSYLENETLTKTQFKCLLSQIVMAIGQVHECNLVYNNANATSIFIIDEGYVLLNDFSKCCDLNTQATHEWMALLKDAVPPEGVEKASITGCWDWWNFG
jgi:serine/threonine protein kinase